MATFTELFINEDRHADKDYQRAFFGCLQKFAGLCANGYGAGEAWAAAKEWALKPFSLSEQEVLLFDDLVGILAQNRKTAVTFYKDGEKRTATVQWNGYRGSRLPECV